MLAEPRTEIHILTSTKFLTRRIMSSARVDTQELTRLPSTKQFIKITKLILMLIIKGGFI